MCPGALLPGTWKSLPKYAVEPDAAQDKRFDHVYKGILSLGGRGGWLPAAVRSVTLMEFPFHVPCFREPAQRISAYVSYSRMHSHCGFCVLGGPHRGGGSSPAGF